MPATPSLLVTKLYQPAARQALVLRPRLLGLMTEALAHPFTLISAPAGFGKTTLVSSWLSRLNLGNLDIESGKVNDEQKIHPSSFTLARASSRIHPSKVAWFALDEDDNDPIRFLTYLTAALGALKPGLGEGVLAALQSPHPPPPKAALTALINELENALSGPTALVLDDYHLVTARPVHEALTFLLEHLPPQLHLVMTTRVDPPLPLGRLRARGQLAEIRAEALRFTPEEAAAFLNGVMNLNLTAEAITVLAERTEGWISGLQLAALSMKGRSDVTGFINSFAGRHRYIIDYLIEEVLQSQPEAIQQFLLQTSLLNHLCSPLCDAVLNQEVELNLSPAPLPPRPRASSQEILEYLERSNLFLTPLDDERRWYRYHHLFAEVLQHQLQRLQPEMLPLLHGRASLWYEQAGFTAEAIQHALQGGQMERATHLVEQAALEALKRGQLLSLLKWLEALPFEAIEARPQLAIFYAWTLLFNSQPVEAEAWLQKAVETEPAPAIVGQAAAIRAFSTILQGDIAAALEFSQQALQLLPEDTLLLQGVALIATGVSDMLKGDVKAAIRIFSEISERSQASHNSVITILAMGQLAENYKAAGQLRRSAEIYHQALALATSPEGQMLPGAGIIYAGLGTLAYEWNQLAAAQDYLERSFQFGQQLGQTGAFDSYLLQVWLKHAQGDVTGAFELIDRVERLLEEFTSLGDSLLQIMRVRFWLMEGNLPGATAWAAGYYPLKDSPKVVQASPNALYLLEELEGLALARWLIVQGRANTGEAFLPDALARLKTLRQAAETLGRLGSLIEIELLQALAYQAQGDLPQALATLESALSLAEPEGYIRLILNEGPPMAELLSTLKSQPTSLSQTYLDQLLTAFTEPKSPALNIKALSTSKKSIQNAESEIQNLKSKIQNPIESLSERELEILRLIADGHSNDQIAQILIIALGTVKKHVNNIYGKLGVHSRTQALVRAKELGLL